MPNYQLRGLIVFGLLCAGTCLGVVVIFMLEVLETASIGDAYYFQEKYMGDTSDAPSCSQQGGGCSPVVEDSVKLTLLILLTPITIFFVKKLIMAVLAYSVRFRKFPNEVSKIKSQTVTLTFFYFLVVGVLHLVLYLKTGPDPTDSGIY
jgi:hypothetical protein